MHLEPITRQVVKAPFGVVRAEYVIDIDLPDEERCRSAEGTDRRCQLELGHDGCHIHVTDNYTVGWLSDAS